MLALPLAVVRDVPAVLQHIIPRTMRSFVTFALLATLFVVDATLARPYREAAIGSDTAHLREVNGVKVAQLQGQTMMAASSRRSEPLPRLLSHRSEVTLPNGRRPADLGADDWTKVPRGDEPSIDDEDLDYGLDKRHDRVDSGEAANEASCNVGEAQCCQSIHQSNDRNGQFLRSLLGLALPAGGGMLGAQCTPLANLLAVTGSSTCRSQPVCCTGNEYRGLVAVGCSPISA
ncbi:SubName: Full=Uncharacterized protein {ECO:0000313/EMBL:CCA66384.1} [Serendipita indica DSM 11827]|nr:SubName: Full=Uncharacterized protein {ECO:0000313/EMBL:CCA66384.1} [Serendipita indica DSM 11827]